jgi:light-regulated signal transduction histidine kinase (bacteriophytochrome)
MADIRKILGDVVGHEQGLLSDRGRNQRRSARSALAAMAALGGVAFGILGLTAFRVREELTRRSAAQELAENLNSELKHRAAELASEIEVRLSAEEAVRKRNEELKAFAYTVSHDLKAPLRGITGYAQELERRHQEGLAERGRFCVAQIITATRNLDSLIDDLLRYARLDAEQVRETELKLPEVVDSVLWDRKQTIAELGALVTVDVPPIAFRTWERGLRQALSNLIDNALKYSRGSTPPRVWIKAASSEHALTVTVADNGIGFDMKYHDRIFGLFNRLVRASEFEGTGAGLAIVRKVLERMGGAVQAESAPGQGATFTIRLARHEA